jgi:hypothetical protein
MLKNSQLHKNLKVYDGSIWLASKGEVSRYDGKTITDFKGDEGQK